MFGFEARTKAILDAVRREGTISGAARSLGIDPSNARRHLRLAERRLGVALVRARRGGRDSANTTLAPAARRLLVAGGLVGSAGEYDPDAGVTPIRVAGRVLFAAGRHAGLVTVEVPPESLTLQRPGPDAPTSARNRLAARVESLAPEGEGTWRVRLRAGGLSLDALIVTGAVKELRLRRGSRVVALVKAVAIRVTPR